MKGCILGLLVVSLSSASPITLTMDEVSNQLINGLAVSKGGMDFTFTNPAQTLYYNSSGPGTVTYVQDPSIQGDVSAFGVTFSVPVYSIQFGMAELTTSLAPLATVDLYNGVTLLASMTLYPSLVDPFAEGLFSYSGTPVTSIQIGPNLANEALAFDNLTVEMVPEPSSALLVVAGASLLVVAARRRRRVC